LRNRLTDFVEGRQKTLSLVSACRAYINEPSLVRETAHVLPEEPLATSHRAPNPELLRTGILGYYVSSNAIVGCNQQRDHNGKPERAANDLHGESSRHDFANAAIAASRVAS
jgi:hypothetical protein